MNQPQLFASGNAAAVSFFARYCSVVDTVNQHVVCSGTHLHIRQLCQIHIDLWIHIILRIHNSGDAAGIDVALNFSVIAAARNDTERPLCKRFPRNIVNRAAVSEQDVDIVADDIGNSGGRI